MESPISCNRYSNDSNDNRENANPQHFAVPQTPHLKQLGYGTGIGVYHLDRHVGRSPKSPWALKKVLRTHKNNDDFGNRLHYEASLLQKLNHPNIIGFRGITSTEDGRQILAMEECTMSLGDMIEDRFVQNDKTIFTASQIRKVCVCIAKALDYLHNEVRLMHGDIKSPNVLINGDFKEIKLCDFGVSIKVDEHGKALSNYVGTESWTSPEALIGDDVTTKADIFSLGLVIYEMIALQPPHLGDIFCEDEDAEETFSECDVEDNYGTRPEIPDIKFGDEYKPILDLFNSCTEQNPTKRPSAKEIVDRLAI